MLVNRSNSTYHPNYPNNSMNRPTMNANSTGNFSIVNANLTPIPRTDRNPTANCSFNYYVVSTSSIQTHSTSTSMNSYVHSNPTNHALSTGFNSTPSQFNYTPINSHGYMQTNPKYVQQQPKLGIRPVIHPTAQQMVSSNQYQHNSATSPGLPVQDPIQTNLPGRLPNSNLPNTPQSLEVNQPNGIPNNHLANLNSHQKNSLMKQNIPNQHLSDELNGNSTTLQLENVGNPVSCSVCNSSSDNSPKNAAYLTNEIPVDCDQYNLENINQQSGDQSNGRKLLNPARDGRLSANLVAARSPHLMIERADSMQKLVLKNAGLLNDLSANGSSFEQQNIDKDQQEKRRTEDKKVKNREGS